MSETFQTQTFCLVKRKKERKIKETLDSLYRLLSFETSHTRPCSRSQSELWFLGHCRCCGLGFGASWKCLSGEREAGGPGELVSKRHSSLNDSTARGVRRSRRPQSWETATEERAADHALLHWNPLSGDEEADRAVGTRKVPKVGTNTSVLVSDLPLLRFQFIQQSFPTLTTKLF